MLRIFLSFPIILLLFQIPYAQTNTFRTYVDTLSSKSFYGRGYVKDGHLKAANYIANEFEIIGLHTFNNNSFFQKFPISVNTFPYDITVKISGETLKEGIDFILDPASSSINGKFRLIRVDLNNYESILDRSIDYSNHVFLLDVSNILNKDTITLYKELKYKLSNIRPVIWTSNEKLTWSVSSYQLKYPVIISNKEINISKDTFVEIDIQSEFKKMSTQNICGYLNGRKNKNIVITAHYDHLGMLGEAIFPGANDNASGVSVLLNLAKLYSNKANKYNLIFICFGGEELGLLGSKFFTLNPLFDLNKIEFLINLDIVGTGDDGIAIINAIDHKKQLKQIVKINNKLNLFPKIKIRGQAPNSDHYWFSKKSVPSIFIYTLGGIPAYHDVMDRSETLPLSRVNELFLLITSFLEKL